MLNLKQTLKKIQHRLKKPNLKKQLRQVQMVVLLQIIKVLTVEKKNPLKVVMLEINLIVVMVMQISLKLMNPKNPQMIHKLKKKFLK